MKINKKQICLGDNLITINPVLRIDSITNDIIRKFARENEITFDNACEVFLYLCSTGYMKGSDKRADK